MEFLTTTGSSLVERGANSDGAFGLANAGFVATSYLGSSNYSGGSFTASASNFVSSGFTSNYVAGAITPLTGDVFAIAVDLTAGKYWLSRNNVWYGGGAPATGANPMVSIAAPAAGLAYFPGLTLQGPNAGVYTLQSTAASQKYAPPSGFVAWDGAGTAPSHSAEALAYLARTVGGDEGGNGANIATLIDGLVSDGVWAKLDALYVLAQQNQSDAMLNLIGTSYGLTSVGLLRSVIFTSYVGFGGFHSGVYLDTGFNPAAATSPKFIQNAASLGAWGSGTGGEVQPTMGNDGGSVAGLSHLYTNVSGSFYARVNGVVGAVPSTGAAGLYVGDRPSSATVVPYYNGAAQAAQSATSDIPLNVNIWIGTAPNVSGATAQTLSAAFIGASLGAAGQLALYNRLRTYMSSVGVP